MLLDIQQILQLYIATTYFDNASLPIQHRIDASVNGIVYIGSSTNGTGWHITRVSYISEADIRWETSGLVNSMTKVWEDRATYFEAVTISSPIKSVLDTIAAPNDVRFLTTTITTVPSPISFPSFNINAMAIRSIVENGTDVYIGKTADILDGVYRMAPGEALTLPLKATLTPIYLSAVSGTAIITLMATN